MEQFTYRTFYYTNVINKIPIVHYCIKPICDICFVRSIFLNQQLRITINVYTYINLEIYAISDVQSTDY